MSRSTVSTWIDEGKLTRTDDKLLFRDLERFFWRYTETLDLRMMDRNFARTVLANASAVMLREMDQAGENKQAA